MILIVPVRGANFKSEIVPKRFEAAQQLAGLVVTAANVGVEETTKVAEKNVVEESFLYFIKQEKEEKSIVKN